MLQNLFPADGQDAHVWTHSYLVLTTATGSLRFKHSFQMQMFDSVERGELGVTVVTAVNRRDDE